MLIKKIFNYILISICAFLFSCNVCYNLTTIIKNNIKLSWDISVFYYLLQLKDLSLLFGSILLTTLIMLFVLKYDKELKLKLQKLKKMPEEDGSFEYGDINLDTLKFTNTKKDNSYSNALYIK